MPFLSSIMRAARVVVSTSEIPETAAKFKLCELLFVIIDFLSMFSLVYNACIYSVYRM